MRKGVPAWGEVCGTGLRDCSARTALPRRQQSIIHTAPACNTSTTTRGARCIVAQHRPPSTSAAAKQTAHPRCAVGHRHAKQGGLLGLEAARLRVCRRRICRCRGRHSQAPALLPAHRCRRRRQALPSGAGRQAAAAACRHRKGCPACLGCRCRAAGRCGGRTERGHDWGG